MASHSREGAKLLLDENEYAKLHGQIGAAQGMHDHRNARTQIYWWIATQGGTGAKTGRERKLFGGSRRDKSATQGTDPLPSKECSTTSRDSLRRAATSGRKAHETTYKLAKTITRELQANGQSNKPRSLQFNAVVPAEKLKTGRAGTSCGTFSLPLGPIGHWGLGSHCPIAVPIITHSLWAKRHVQQVLCQ